MERSLDREALDLAMKSLAIRLVENHAEPIEIVVCGGSALILTGMIPRTTKDVDVVALIRAGQLASPAPLPDRLRQAAKEVAEDLALGSNWLNNGPSSGEGGLFQMGLPVGFADRLVSSDYGEALKIHFIHRVDQIHFKLYASADRGGYHIEDLRALSPTPDELTTAAQWCMTHDVSEGFKMVLKQLLKEMGYENVADRI
jgi:hypothetical protein